jgi:hypothetical protein
MRWKLTSYGLLKEAFAAFVIIIMIRSDVSLQVEDTWHTVFLVGMVNKMAALSAAKNGTIISFWTSNV